MAKPAEVKKRARSLAQEGKIVDAIRVLEELAQHDAVDPYDLVTLGDLCMRGGRVQDAATYYERAVLTYRDASLLRNGIALCRKVIRSQTGDNRFLLHLADLCEREGLTLDAVASYLEFAESLNPDEATGEEEWLNALARLTPKNVELLTRQAELLVRWNRATEAVSILRYGADSTSIGEDRDKLLQMAEQMAVLDGVETIDGPVHALDDPGGEDIADWIAPVPGEGTPGENLRDLDLKVEPRAKSREDVYDITDTTDDEVEAADVEPPASVTSGVPEPGVYDIDLSEDETAPDTLEVSAEAFETETSDATDSSGAEDEELVTTYSLSELRQTRPGGRSDANGSGEDLAELQEAIKRDPFNVDILEKLLELYESERDILSSLDLRERLAQAYLNADDKPRAFEHYRHILLVEPGHRTVRQRYRALAEELGEPDEFAGRHAKASRVQVGGMAHVEVRDDRSAQSDGDMLDLGALLSEFKDGLKHEMQDATAQSFYDMGLSHMEMGLYAEAAEAFEVACEDPAIEPEARELWGRCLREGGQLNDAIRVLRAALALRPESMGVRYQLALALEMDDQTDEARRLHQSIVREDPDFEDSRHRIDALGGTDCPTPPPPSYS